MNQKLNPSSLDQIIQAVYDESEPARAVGSRRLLLGWLGEGRSGQLEITTEQLERIEAALAYDYWPILQL